MKQVQLVCGTLVDSNSEEWRHECEARTVLALETPGKRKARLLKVQERRGAEAVAALRCTMTVLWAHTRAAELRGLDEKHRNESLKRIADAMGTDVGELIRRLCAETPIPALNDSSKRAA